MKTLWLAGGLLWSMVKWLGEVRRMGKMRLSVESARADRLKLEKMAEHMRRGAVAKLPRSLRWLCGWLHKLGRLDDIGTYLTALLKSQKLADHDPELYRTH